LSFYLSALLFSVFNPLISVFPFREAIWYFQFRLEIKNANQKHLYPVKFMAMKSEVYPACRRCRRAVPSETFLAVVSTGVAPEDLSASGGSYWGGISTTTPLVYPTKRLLPCANLE
jgi:hypothetical protein